MNTADAVKMVLIMADADGGCSFCAKSLLDDAVKVWPDVDWQTVIKRVATADNWRGEETAELLRKALAGEVLT